MLEFISEGGCPNFGGVRWLRLTWLGHPLVDEVRSAGPHEAQPRITFFVICQEDHGPERSFHYS